MEKLKTSISRCEKMHSVSNLPSLVSSEILKTRQYRSQESLTDLSLQLVKNCEQNSTKLHSKTSEDRSQIFNLLSERVCGYLGKKSIHFPITFRPCNVTKEVGKVTE